MALSYACASIFLLFRRYKTLIFILLNCIFYSFKTIEIDGDKRIAQIVVNKLNINKDPLGDLALLIDAKKKISVSNKNSSGKILEYNMILNFRVEIKDNSKNEII